MFDFANDHQIDVVAVGSDVCRDERCDVLSVHIQGPHCVKMRGRETLYRTRSRRHATQPWRAYSYEALHESVYNAISVVEPRNFGTVLSIVENDYGTCCERSVHRHLKTLRHTGEIVRMDFKGRIHAYLRAGSRMISDPILVLEQIIDLHATIADVEPDMFAEGTGVHDFA